MTTIHCPSNCDHEWDYLHSLIVNERTFKNPSGDVILEVRTFVVCGECNHWVNGGRGCTHFCHDDEGEFVVRTTLHAVN